MSNRSATNVDWVNVQGIIFDMDGTLYDRRNVHLHMLAELLIHALNPRHWIDIRILYRFRQLREQLADAETENFIELQYALVAKHMGVTKQRVHSVVSEWIDRRPLKYLRCARRSGIAEVFALLQQLGIRIGVLSDYPVLAKLDALELEADAICSSDEDGVRHLKPHPAGLHVLLGRLGLEARNCVMIGDRIDRDGACAQALNMRFLLCRGATFYIDLIAQMRCVGRLREAER